MTLSHFASPIGQTGYQDNQGALPRATGLSAQAGSKRLIQGYGQEARGERRDRERQGGKIDSLRFHQRGPLQVNGDLLDRNMGVLSIDVDSSTPRKELVEKLSLIEGVFLVQTHVGSLVGIMFFYEDDKSLERRVGLISKVADARGAKFTRIPFPKSSVSLSKTDWRIVSTQKRNLKSYGEISKELRLSTRTVRRRMVRMVAGGAVFTFPSANAEVIREAIMVDLVVEYESPKTRHQVDKKLLELLDPYYIFAGIWESHSLYSMIIPSFPTSREILDAVRRVSGTKSARIELVEDRYEFYDRLNEVLERKLTALQIVH
jgi:DNA-binding Lrp family transcriptional regulator